VARVGLLAALARAPLARGQASDPSAMECSMDNLGDRLKTIESICCTSPTMCAEGPPSDADQCTVACGEVLAPPMHMHQLRFAYGPAYRVQRRLYANEGAEPHPARAPVYRQKPPIADAVLAWLAHFYRRSIV